MKSLFPEVNVGKTEKWETRQGLEGLADTREAVTDVWEGRVCSWRWEKLRGKG